MSVDVKQIIIENKEKVSYYIKKMNELEQKDNELKLQILMHNFQKEEKYRKEKDEKNDREKKHIERMNRFTIEQQKKKEESKEKKCNKDKIEKETLKERQKSVSCYKKYDDKKIDEFIFKNEKLRDENINDKDPYYSRLKDEINKDLTKKNNLEKKRSSIVNKDSAKIKTQQNRNLAESHNISINENQDFYNNASLETPMDFIKIMENKKSIQNSISNNNTSINMNLNNNNNNDNVIKESKNAPSGSEEELNSEAQFFPDDNNQISNKQYKVNNSKDNNNNHNDNIYKERRMSDSSNYIVSSKKNLLTSNNDDKEVKKKSKVNNLKNYKTKNKTKNKTKSKNKLNSNNIIDIKNNKSKQKLMKSKILVTANKSNYQISQVNKIAKSKHKKPLYTKTVSNNISAKAIKPKIPVSNSSNINKKSDNINPKTTEKPNIKTDSNSVNVNKKKIKKDTKSSKSVSKLISKNKSMINNSIKIANIKKCNDTNSNFIRLIKDNEREKEFLGYNFNTSFARDKDYVKAFSKSISSFNSKAVHDSQSKRKYRNLRHDGLNLKMRIYNGKADPVTLYKDFKDEWKRLKFLNIRKKMKIIDKNDSVAKNTLLLKIKKMLKPIHLVKEKGSSIEFNKENSHTNDVINNRLINDSLKQSYNYNSHNKIDMSNLNNEIDNDYYNKENYNEEYEDNIPIDANMNNKENDQANSEHEAIYNNLYNDNDNNDENENDINYELSNINDELETKMQKILA